MKAKQIFPFLVLFALLALLWYELFYTKPGELPSALLGKPVPTFELPTLYSSKKFTQSDLIGQVSLLNIWATWCYACNVEHAMLIKIQQQYRIPIYSINYKDDPTAAKKWLSQLGNPYTLTGVDRYGDVAIDLGVYGTPETFIINSKGNIVYRHIGVIDQKNWDEVLYPVVKKYAQT